LHYFNIRKLFSTKWSTYYITLDVHGILRTYYKGKLKKTIDVKPVASQVVHGINTMQYSCPLALPEWANTSMLLLIPKNAFGSEIWLLFGNPTDS
jgi:hypothetical protein